MNYTKSVDFNGNTAAAFAIITATLTASGFRLVSQDSRRLQFSRAFCAGGHERWTPLRWVSEISVTAGSRQLSLEAESGGMRRKAGWIVAPVAAAAVAIAGAFAKVATRSTVWNADKWLQVSALAVPVLIIAIVLPLSLRFAGRRSTMALDLIIENAAMAARAT